MLTELTSFEVVKKKTVSSYFKRINMNFVKLCGIYFLLNYYLHILIELKHIKCAAKPPAECVQSILRILALFKKSPLKLPINILKKEKSKGRHAISSSVILSLK